MALTILRVIKATAPEINFEESYPLIEDFEDVFLPSTELILMRRSLSSATNPIDRYSIEHQLTKLYYQTYKRSVLLFDHQKLLVELGDILFNHSGDETRDIKRIKAIGRELKKIGDWCCKWSIDRYPMFRNILVTLWKEKPRYD